MIKGAFQDETILRKREERKKEQHASLETGLYLNGTVVSFKREQVAKEVFVMIPETFEVMPMELARIKYPSVFRPHHLLTNEQLTVNMGFSVFPDHLEEMEIQSVGEQVKQTLQSSQDVCDFGEVAVLRKVQGCCFHFRQHVPDGDLYQVMGMIRMGQYLCQCTFHCAYPDHPDWEKMVPIMWESMEYEKKKGVRL